jgi:hypothetical protein
MSMIDGVATLEISSPANPAAYVTTVLGIEPDWSAERGDLRPRQGDSGSEPIRRRVYDTSMWVLEVESNPGTKMAIDEDDAKGFATLQVLVDRLFGRGPLLAQLKQHYRVELTWYGTAGASQAGFMLPSSLLAALGELGLDVLCTVYAHDDTSERPGLHVGQAQLSPLVAGLAEIEASRGPAPVEKTPEQLAAEQLLADSFVAEQLFEQSARDREGQ